MFTAMLAIGKKRPACFDARGGAAARAMVIVRAACTAQHTKELSGPRDHAIQRGVAAVTLLFLVLAHGQSEMRAQMHTRGLLLCHGWELLTYQAVQVKADGTMHGTNSTYSVGGQADA
jgi:hypothetical protein